jgi:hypothetical protein
VGRTTRTAGRYAWAFRALRAMGVGRSVRSERADVKRRRGRHAAAGTIRRTATAKPGGGAVGFTGWSNSTVGNAYSKG